MPVEVVKRTKEYTIYQKPSKRYAVRNAERKWVNGDEKVKILVTEKLLDKSCLPSEKPAEEEVVEEAPAEEAAAKETSEEASEEAPAEEEAKEE